MKESKEPFCATNSSHIRSNFAIIVAAVCSILNPSVDCPASRRSWERDAIGGAFKTLSPQPDFVREGL